MIRPDRYLTKPLDIPRFLELLEKVVAGGGEGAMSEAAAPDMIVVIDDDYAMRLSCSKILSKMGLRVEVFEMGPAGWKVSRSSSRAWWWWT